MGLIRRIVGRFRPEGYNRSAQRERIYTRLRAWPGEAAEPPPEESCPRLRRVLKRSRGSGTLGA
jgi:hypothetical protein